LAFQSYYKSIATPFEWRFTKDDLAALMRKLDGGRVANTKLLGSATSWCQRVAAREAAILRLVVRPNGHSLEGQ